MMLGKGITVGRENKQSENKQKVLGGGVGDHPLHRPPPPKGLNCAHSCTLRAFKGSEGP